MNFGRYSLVAISLIGIVNFSGCGSDENDDNNSSNGDINQTIDINNSNDNDNIDHELYSVQPFLRVAELNGGWESVPDIALLIAEYIDETNETSVLGADKYPTNWVIAGAENGVENSILAVPYTIEDNSTQKVKIVELCNKSYANMAMSAGTYHAPALPCEIAIHSENNKTYVDILDPNAIFSLFFTDMPEENKEGLKTVASQVKTEIVGMIEASLTNSGKEFLSKDIALGPKYNENQFSTLYETEKPYDIFNYSGDENKTFTQVDVNLVKDEILTYLGSEEAPSTVAGLSVSDWRSPREDSLSIPGALIIEACSPIYAKMAISTGVHHATALPCEIGITVADNNKTLQISYLNPNYMFKVLFADAFESMSNEEKILFSSLPITVLSDLKLIVNSAISDLNSSDLTLNLK
jgi:uncharacterized protein (DUF302 family)